MRFSYDDNYYTDLSMALYKVLCDDHAGYFCIGQDQTRILLWISGHGRYKRMVHTICEGLMAAKDFFMSMWTLLGK